MQALLWGPFLWILGTGGQVYDSPVGQPWSLSLSMWDSQKRVLISSHLGVKEWGTLKHLKEGSLGEPFGQLFPPSTCSYLQLSHFGWFTCWERLRAGKRGDRGCDGWMASLTQWTWVWASSKSEGQGSLACCCPGGCEEFGHDRATEQQQTSKSLHYRLEDASPRSQKGGAGSGLWPESCLVVTGSPRGHFLLLAPILQHDFNRRLQDSRTI